MASTCGCTLNDFTGQPADWADAALTIAQTEIRDKGWEANRDYLIHEIGVSNHFQTGSPTFQDDEVTENFSMDLLNPFRQADEWQESHEDGSHTFNPGTRLSRDDVTALISTDSHPACDPRAFQMVATGSERFRGTVQAISIRTKVHCIHNYRGKTRGQFGKWLMEMMRALPQGAIQVRDWNMFVTLANNAWNSAESGAQNLEYLRGVIPYVPSAALNPISLLQYEDFLRGNGYRREKLWHATPRVLRSAALFQQFNGAQGFGVYANNFQGPPAPEVAVGDSITIGGVRFKAVDLPFGYMEKTGPSKTEFKPIDRRYWEALDRGVRAYGSSEYDTAWWNDPQGIERLLVSPVWSADPGAYILRPFGVDQKTPVTKGSEAWALTSKVNYIGGAFIPCNTRQDKFYAELNQAWKMDPVQPRETAVFWVVNPGYERIENRIGMTRYGDPASAPATVHPGMAITDLTCTEKAICAAGGDLPEHVGVFDTLCKISVVDGATVLTLGVVRNVPPGHQANGIVSIDYATAPGTATAGVGYTTTSGTLSWADGECGLKEFAVTLLPGTALPGTSFNVNYSNVLPAPSYSTLLPATRCTTTLITFPEAEDEE